MHKIHVYLNISVCFYLCVHVVVCIYTHKHIDIHTYVCPSELLSSPRSAVLLSLKVSQWLHIYFGIKEAV